MSTRDFDVKFISYVRDVIVAFFYNMCCKCCCCCSSETRGPAACRRRAKYLERHAVATERLYQEQDIQQVIVASRLIRLFARILLDRRQRRSLNYSTRYNIEDDARGSVSGMVADELTVRKEDLKILHKGLDLQGSQWDRILMHEVTGLRLTDFKHEYGSDESDSDSDLS